MWPPNRFVGIRTDAVAVVALAALVTTMFAVTTTFDFVDFDDQDVVVKNPFVNHGLTWSGLRWAWGFGHTPETADWWNWPLTWMTHQLDCQLYDLWAGGHHLTNVALHTCGTVAFFAVLRMLTFSPGMAFILAAIYGIHPAQIESVAWITSRKNVLSALFFFGAIAAYVRAHGASGAHRGIAAMLSWNLLAVGAMLSKATTVTLPLVLLLMDWWPLRRLRLPHLGPPTDDAMPAAGPWRAVGEKSILFALALWTMLLGYRVQDAAGAIHGGFAPLGRVGHVARTIVAYLEIFVSPAHVSPFYPTSDESPPLGVSLACGLLIACMTAGALSIARTRPMITVGWLWFLVTLAPTVGLVQVGGAAWACRHLQIPMAGLLIAAGSVYVAATSRFQTGARGLRWAAAALLIGFLAMLTSRQLPIWRDAPSLAEAMLEHNPGNASQWCNLAIVLERYSAAPPAVIDELFSRAFVLSATESDRAVITCDHGLFLLKQHDNERACDMLRECLRLAQSADQMKSPVANNATTNLAVGLTRLEKADEAVALLEALHARARTTPTSLNALGNALTACGKHPDALEVFERALAFEPNDIVLNCNAATAAMRAGDETTARRYLSQAQQRDPHSPAVAAAAAVLGESR